MSVTPGQVNEMAKLIAAMSAAENSTPSRSTPKAMAESQQPVRSTLITPDTEAMSKIMAAFNKAAEGVVETAATNHYPELKRALVTEATTKGSREGSWEIELRQVEGMGKFYNVTHTTTGEPIAVDLRLYEAALGLVRALNEGETITSSQIKTILTFEEEYARNLTDAVGYASRMKITEGASHDVAEARYSEAKRRALSAKKSLTSFCKI